MTEKYVLKLFGYKIFSVEVAVDYETSTRERNIGNVEISAVGQLYDLTSNTPPTPAVLPDGCIAIGELGGHEWLYKNRNERIIAIRLNDAESSLTYNNGNALATVFIKTTADFQALCSDTDYTSLIIVDGVSIVKNTIKGVYITKTPEGITAIPANFCREFRAMTSLDISGLSEVTAIGANFLWYCRAFNQGFTIPSGVTAIGDYFLYACQAFNQPIELPPGMTALSQGFLYGCIAFNQPLIIPANITTINRGFLWRPNAMISTVTVEAPSPTVISDEYSLATEWDYVPCYTQGIPIAGAGAENVFSALPDSDVSPYRKLLGRPTHDYLEYTDGHSIAQVDIVTADDFQALCSDSADNASITINGVNIVKNTIISVHIPVAPVGFTTTIPAVFCCNFSALRDIDLTGLSGATVIEHHFLSDCVSFNPANGLTLPAGVTEIGDGFMQHCTSFNPANGFELPAGVTEIYDYFMSDCRAFNPENGTLTLPDGLQIIGDYFMYNCHSFNPANGFEIPAGVTEIGYSFMCYCAAFNPPTGLVIPASLSTINGNFMVSCSAFNPSNGLMIPAGVTQIKSNSFMAACANMSGTITFLGTPTIVSDTTSLSTSDSNDDLYKEGVKVTGAGASAAIAAWPNRTSSPYRKLIQV
jgi:hypothetical protein